MAEYYNMKIAGLDIGTTGCKLTVFDQNGVYLDKAYQGILNGVKDGTVAEARINDSLKRVLRVKFADKLNDFMEE